MNAHTDANRPLRAQAIGLRGDPSLNSGGAAQSLHAIGEQDQEAIARQFHLESGVAVQFLTHDIVVVVDDRLPLCVAQSFREVGRIFDVREEHRGALSLLGENGCRDRASAVRTE